MKRYIIVVLMALAGVFEVSGQQRTVIAGLEGDAEYRALIDQEGALVRTADSLAAEIASLRRRLRTDTLGRAATSAAIVRMEEAGFEIRSGMARLASRINTIEQEWILANLAGAPAAVPAAQNDEATPGRHSANLVYSSWFERGLSPEQLAELHRAQEAESEMPRLVAQYREGHGRLRVLAREYELASSQGAADSLRAEFDALDAAGSDIGRQAGTLWETVFDSKSYLYNLLADKENRRNLLARLEQGMERLRSEQPAVADVPAAFVNYVSQKRMLTEYEIALAAELGNSAAADSLRRVAAALPGPESLADLTPVTLTERLFLDYSDISIGDSPYSSTNPIPEVAVWPKGIIWRVQVGNFSTRQAPSVFREAHPVAVQTGDDKRFRYFAGGFPTDSLAGAAVEQLQKAGFRAPSAVVWMDGVFIDPAAESERIYRLDISGVEELPPAVREFIAGSTGEAGVDIVRGGGVFVVAPLDGAAAVRMRTALEAMKATYPGMEIKLSKNPE